MSLALIGSFASADFLSLSTGVGEWNQKINGYVKSSNTINYFNKRSAETDGNDNTGNFGLKNKTNPYVWIKIIHPIPIIPNIKFQYTKYNTSGHSNYIAANIKLFDTEINTAITNADTKQIINSYDTTLFCEFKPAIADIEAGFGVDYWQGHTTIYGNVDGKTKNWVDNKWKALLPYLYAHVETMHLFGFSIISNGKYAKAKDAHHYDYTGAFKYTIDVPGPVNPFIKAGYRYKEVYTKSVKNATLLTYKGAFLEIGAKF